MVVTCPACGSPAVPFAVPEDLREMAPEGAARAAVCTRCLRTFAVDERSPESPGSDAPDAPDASDDTDAPDLSAIHPAFPDGRGGVAFALACGLLGSLALNRSAVESLVAYAEREGVDVFLALDRLADADADANADTDADADVDPHFDAARRRTQLEQFL